MSWDAFICYASEDKSFACELYTALTGAGLSVWFDEQELGVGDAFRDSIDIGIRNSKYGIVIISPNFIAKEWPRTELTALYAKERAGDVKILPVWYGVGPELVERVLPMLADRSAAKYEQGIEQIVDMLVRAIRREKSMRRTSVHEPIKVTLPSSLLSMNFFSVMMGFGYPSIAASLQNSRPTNLPVNELIIAFYLLVAVVIATSRVKTSWTRFINNLDINYRVDVVAMLLFGFFFTILNSGIFVSVNTQIPLYKFLLSFTDQKQIVKWTFVLNCLFATIPAVLYWAIHSLYLYKSKNDIYKVTLWGPTFIMTFIPIGFTFIIILLFAERNFASYVFVALFPFILSVLAIQGYSHRFNNLGDWAAKVLYIVAIFSCFFGFLMAMLGLLWILNQKQQAPTYFYTSLSIQPVLLDWERISYSTLEYWEKLKPAMVWQVLTGVFFMELFPGFLTVLTIYHYQVTASKGSIKQATLH